MIPYPEYPNSNKTRRHQGKKGIHIWIGMNLSCRLDNPGAGSRKFKPFVPGKLKNPARIGPAPYPPTSVSLGESRTAWNECESTTTDEMLWIEKEPCFTPYSSVTGAMFSDPLFTRITNVQRCRGPGHLFGNVGGAPLPESWRRSPSQGSYFLPFNFIGELFPWSVLCIEIWKNSTSLKYLFIPVLRKSDLNPHRHQTIPYLVLPLKGVILGRIRIQPSVSVRSRDA